MLVSPLGEPAEGEEWLAHKYEALSARVRLTNLLSWGDETAGLTIHAALWNGTAFDVHTTNRLLWNRTRVRLTAGEARLLDAGCGWGGTIFSLEDARLAATANLDGSQPAERRVEYVGLTLSRTQASVANATAAARGHGASCTFLVRSFEEALATGATHRRSRRQDETWP